MHYMILSVFGVSSMGPGLITKLTTSPVVLLTPDPRGTPQGLCNNFAWTKHSTALFRRLPWIVLDVLS